MFTTRNFNRPISLSIIHGDKLRFKLFDDGRAPEYPAEIILSWKGTRTGGIKLIDPSTSAVQTSTQFDFSGQQLLVEIDATNLEELTDTPMIQVAGSERAELCPLISCYNAANFD